MFGYVLPVQKDLKDHEFALYHSFYCGICLTIKSKFGQVARLATGYDMTFLAILLSDINCQQTDFRVCKCLGNPFCKRTVVDTNPLLEKIADISIILAYHKSRDDIMDKSKLKGHVVEVLFKKPYRIAKENSYELDSLIDSSLKDLNSLEKQEQPTLDRLAHPFANMLKQVSTLLCGQNSSDNLQQLCYNIGKFVYLIDALDDLDQDIKKNTFNAYLAASKSWEQEQSPQTKFESKSQFLAKYKTQVEFSLNSTINRSIEAFNNLDFFQSYSVLKNIIHFGLRFKLSQVLNAKGKLSKRLVHKQMLRKTDKVKHTQ
jgi:hypothetical protein